MLRTLVEYVLTLVELAEAEGRALKRGIVRLAVGLVLVLLAGFLLAGAGGLLVAGLYLYLATYLPPAAAISIDGAVLLLVAGGLLWGASRTAR